MGPVDADDAAHGRAPGWAEFAGFAAELVAEPLDPARPPAWLARLGRLAGAHSLVLTVDDGGRVAHAARWDRRDGLRPCPGPGGQATEAGVPDHPIAVGLHHGGRTAGALHADGADPTATAEVLRAVAPLVAAAVERARREQALRASAALLHLVAEHVAVGLMVVDEAGRVRWASPSVTALTGWEPEDLVGSELAELLRDHDASTPAERGRRSDDTRSSTRRVRFLTAGGDWLTLDVTTNRDAAGPTVVTLRDLQRHTRELADLENLALTDPVTGLTNRAGLQAELDRRLAPGAPSAVVFIDLDGFKAVNDTCGHQAGDLLLAEVGRTVRSALRPGDVVGRYGGDEFVVLLDGCDRCGAQTVADRLLVALRTQVPSPAGTLAVSGSIGVAVGGPGVAARTLLGCADDAMYRAKRDGRDRVCIVEADRPEEGTDPAGA